MAQTANIGTSSTGLKKKTATKIPPVNTGFPAPGVGTGSTLGTSNSSGAALPALPTSPVGDFGLNAGVTDTVAKPGATNIARQSTLIPPVNTAIARPGQAPIARQSTVVPPTNEAIMRPEDVNIARQSTMVPPLNVGGTGTGFDDQLSEQMRLRTDRENIQNTQQNRRNAHDRAIRAGFQQGSPQYVQMMRNAETDASNQNITATNRMREFGTAREDEVRDRDVREFETFSKYIESDIGRSLVAEVAAVGGDWQESMASLYEVGADGKRVLRPEHRDKTKPELIKASLDETVNNITKNPEDPTLPWGQAEKDAWVSKKTDQIASQGLGGLDITGDEKDKTAVDKTAFESANTTGNYSEISNQRLQRAIADDEDALDKMDIDTYTSDTLNSLNNNQFSDMGDFEESGLKAGTKDGSVIMYEGRPLRIVTAERKNHHPSNLESAASLGSAKSKKQLVLKGVYLDEPGSVPTTFFKSLKVTY